MPQPPPLRSGWSTVVKGKQTPSIAKDSGKKQAVGGKGAKPERAMSSAATDVSQATSASSNASPNKAVQSSSEASSSSSSAPSKDSVSTHSEQQAEPEKPAKPQPAAGKESGKDKAPDAGEESKPASSEAPAEVRSCGRLRSCIVARQAVPPIWQGHGGSKHAWHRCVLLAGLKEGGSQEQGPTTASQTCLEQGAPFVLHYQALPAWAILVLPVLFSHMPRCCMCCCTGAPHQRVCMLDQPQPLTHLAAVLLPLCAARGDIRLLGTAFIPSCSRPSRSCACSSGAALAHTGRQQGGAKEEEGQQHTARTATSCSRQQQGES